MRKITLGRTNVSVSAISLGTWSFGGPNMSGKRAVGWGGQDDVDSQSALVRAWELGINHWDTADVYGEGRSEQVIGAVWTTIPRKDIFLATKVGWDKGPYNKWYNPAHMKNKLEKSLKNLKTDCLDLTYLHHCDFGKNGELFDEAIETIQNFKKEGKTKFIGLSDWSLKNIMKYADRCDPDVIQPYRNLMDDSYESSGLKKYIDENNLGVCFFSPIKHGLLTGKYKQAVKFESGDFRSNIKDFSNQKILDTMSLNKTKLKQRFCEHPNPVMHGVVDALFTDSPTGCALLGQRNLDQVEVAATLGEVLNKEDSNWVKSLYKNLI